VNPPGVLLDAGPLVAFLSDGDANHQRARRLFAECAPPLRCCEAVVTEACFLIRRAQSSGPGKVIALAKRRIFTTTMSVEGHWANIEALLLKYEDQPMSFADACLVRCAEIHDEPRILTFDSDFGVYRWGRNRKFEIL
jgi:predicted nucleic acid-binding protein